MINPLLGNNANVTKWSDSAVIPEHWAVGLKITVDASTMA